MLVLSSGCVLEEREAVDWREGTVEMGWREGTVEVDWVVLVGVDWFKEI